MAKTAAGLVAHCKAQLGQIYWYGTFGQPPTLDLLLQKHKQYPKYMTAARVAYAKQRHVGKPSARVYDCAGLIKSYFWCDTPTAKPQYNAAQDKSAQGLKGCCAKKGKIATMPEEPGLLVFIGTTHVGVYAGQGRVIEARGFDYGVVETALKSRGWDTWGRLDWLEKPAEQSPGALRIGDRVKIKQTGVPYYPGAIKIPARYEGKTLTVTQDDYPKGSGKTRIIGGKPCVLLSDVVTWCAADNLIKV